MCELCVNAVAEHFPDLPEKEYSRFLFSTTCFPFGTAEQTIKMVEDLASKSGGDIQKACDIAALEFDEDCDRFLNKSSPGEE